ncbi:MAG TPA: alpha-amylase family protein [Leptolyngbyaceae cyanobacterium]
MGQWLIRSALLFGVLTLILVRVPQGEGPSYSFAASPPDSAPFVHLLEWTWPDVAEECERYLGPQGFRAVQVSPPQEHVVLPEQGYPWWQRYQPVSYRLESRSGNRAQFLSMVRRCRKAGVAIYADAVINHMAGVASGFGSGGTPFTKYSYSGLYAPQDFHPCQQPVTDYRNADDVTQCELVGLADLDTSSQYVQSRLAEYLADLVSLGVAGFRIDAAKHMRSQEVSQILARLRQITHVPLFIYQEVIDPGTEAIKKQAYYSNGKVSEFEYGRQVAEAFLGSNGRSLANLKNLGEAAGLAPADQAIVFIDNHDKQRGHGGGGRYLTYKDGPLYSLANVFMLAYPYGVPQIMSSFAFFDPDQGPPTNAAGQTKPVYQDGQNTCFESWVCEHRWRAIGNMVGFRNATASVQTVTDWWTNGSDQIAFGRGSKGFVVINRAAAPLTRTFATQLPPGQYCNVLERRFTNGQGCEDAAILTVDDQGRLTAAVAGVSAIAVHVGAKVG